MSWGNGHSLEIYGAVQVVLVDFVDEDALGIAAQEEEGER